MSPKLTIFHHASETDHGSDRRLPWYPVQPTPCKSCHHARHETRLRMKCRLLINSYLIFNAFIVEIIILFRSEWIQLWSLNWFGVLGIGGNENDTAPCESHTCQNIGPVVGSVLVLHARPASLNQLYFPSFNLL